MKHRDLALWLPDNKLGAAVAALLCVMHLHTTPCRGTPRCARRRFGVPFRPPWSDHPDYQQEWK